MLETTSNRKPTAMPRIPRRPMCPVRSHAHHTHAHTSLSLSLSLSLCIYVYNTHRLLFPAFPVARCVLCGHTHTTHTHSSAPWPGWRSGHELHQRVYCVTSTRAQVQGGEPGVFAHAVGLTGWSIASPLGALCLARAERTRHGTSRQSPCKHELLRLSRAMNASHSLRQVQ
jgi:hypothetical protein